MMGKNMYIPTGIYIYIYIYINNLRKKFSSGPGFEPVSQARRAGDPGSNSGPDENFFVLSC